MKRSKSKNANNTYSLSLENLCANRWIRFIIICILFVFGVFVVPIIINELYKFDSGYITLWDASDVLSFYSVILSGIITIAALIATIHFSRKETERNIKFSKAQTNTPFFIIENVYERTSEKSSYDYQNNLIWEKEYYVTKYGTLQGDFVIKLQNIGEGVAILPTYEGDLLQILDPEKNPKFINKQDVLELNCNLQTFFKNRFSSFPCCSEPFNTYITLSYQNTLGIKFKQKITFTHKFNINKSSIILCVNSISPQSIEI